jgi:choline dehydrogenase
MMRYQAEVVVVGGGSSGAVVAARLAEHSVDVLLVEAGPDYGRFGDPRWPAELVSARALAITHDWGYTNDRWTFERARVIGGCSAHNGAIAAVGHVSDYDGWGLDGWRAADVRPLFDTVIERMRVRAYRRDEAVPFHEQCLQAAESIGWRMASDLCDLDANDSFGLETVNVVGTTRWNTAFAFLDPVRDRANLRIIDQTMIDRFNTVNTHEQTLVGERLGEPVEFSAGTFVVAAGVYGSPAILQRSGVGDADRLRSIGIEPVHHLPGVGANLHDHPMAHVERPIGPALQRMLDDAARAGFVPEEQTLGKIQSSLASDGIYDTHVFPVFGSDQTSMLHGKVAVEVACMTPHSRGRIDVAGADPAAPPVIDHRYLSDPDGHDLTVLRDGLARAREIVEHTALDGLLGPSAPTAVDDHAIRSAVAHYYHPVGTCAMGTGPAAVCTARGAIHGLDGVIVADASIMPVIPRANTNLPAVMIGERIASFLLEP